ncbi:hypothetical protein T484DRAFT_1790148, partial [Baffinella frigidus]
MEGGGSEEEEDRILEALRKDRAQQEGGKRKGGRGGVQHLAEVLDVTAHSFLREVHACDAGVWVVVHIFDHDREDCALLHEVTNELARRHVATTKF